MACPERQDCKKCKFYKKWFLGFGGCDFCNITGSVEPPFRTSGHCYAYTEVGDTRSNMELAFTMRRAESKERTLRIQNPTIIEKVQQKRDQFCKKHWIIAGLAVFFGSVLMLMLSPWFHAAMCTMVAAPIIAGMWIMHFLFGKAGLILMGIGAIGFFVWSITTEYHENL